MIRAGRVLDAIIHLGHRRRARKLNLAPQSSHLAPTKGPKVAGERAGRKWANSFQAN